MIKIKCLICNKEFETYQCLNRKYCSKGCYSKWRIGKSTVTKGRKFPERCGKNHPLYNGGAEIICRICQKKFNVCKSREKIAKVCSRECYKKWRKQYCKEKHWNWKGGINTSYTWAKDWRELRNKILKRDNYKCQKCNKMEKLEIHHIIHYELCKEHKDSNLITLCRNCHRKEHFKRRR